MTVSNIKYYILGLGAVLIMSFLYIKTQAVDLEKHNQILDRSSQLERSDAVLNQYILEIHQSLLPFYDPTVNKMNQLDQLRVEMHHMLRQLFPDNSHDVNQHMEEISRGLIEKRDLLEQFKSSNALQRNSLRYLPIATAQLSTLLPSDAEGEKLKQAINALLRDILIYNLTSEAKLRSSLASSAETLSNTFARHLPKKQQQDLDILLAHVRIVLEHKMQSDRIMQQLLAIPTAQRMDELLGAYTANHNQMMRSSDAYRWVLYGFSVLLLCFISYILLRLNQTSTTLRRTVVDLNYQKFAMDQHAIVSVTDRTGAIIYANQKFCDISQRTCEELIGQNHRLSKSSHHTASFYKAMWDTVAEGKIWHGQIQEQSRDGSHYWVETTIVPFMDEGGSPYKYVAIRTDITEIKEAEEQLRVQMAALEAAANGIIITDSHGNIQWVNKAFSALTGYSQKEVIGQTPRLLESGKHGPLFYKELWETILAGQIWQGELINRRKDGTLYTEEQTISPVYDKHGKIIRFIAIMQDITERQQIEEALRRSQKMEAIGQLSGGIAHDFNNQLGVIIGYLDFLQEYVGKDEKPAHWINTATNASLRCMDLTRQLLTFSRSQAREKTVVDINAKINELESMITRSVTPEITVQSYLTDNLWRTEINAGEFHDALLNMVINARDAMPSGGTLLIETNNKQLDASYAALNPGVEPGSYVQLMISDTGTGMGKEILERVFEPFFTTKPAGKGTGLGMAMIYGFVKRYGGFIKLYSEPNIGTTIRLYLPRSNATESEEITESLGATDIPRGNESILIVDDEDDLLQLANQYLSDLGYHTSIAKNAAQALDILSGDSEFDLLFSDVVMPGGMNGYELAQAAVQAHPTIKVLLTSGFTSKTIARNGLAKFATDLLDKPYRKKDLAQRIRYLLDGGTVE